MGALWLGLHASDRDAGRFAEEALDAPRAGRAGRDVGVAGGSDPARGGDQAAPARAVGDERSRPRLRPQAAECAGSTTIRPRGTWSSRSTRRRPSRRTPTRLDM